MCLKFQLRALLYAVRREEAARSSTETDRDRDLIDDEVDRRQMAANRAGQKIAMKTGAGRGRTAPDQIDPDDVTTGNARFLTDQSLQLCFHTSIETTRGIVGKKLRHNIIIRDVKVIHFQPLPRPLLSSSRAKLDRSLLHTGRAWAD